MVSRPARGVAVDAPAQAPARARARAQGQVQAQGQAPGRTGALPPTTRDLVAQLRRRALSAEEVTRACLDAIEQHDPGLGAFVEVGARRALSAARRADRLLDRRDPAAPVLLGVPLAIKDHEHLRGYGTRAGSRALAWAWSPVNGEVAAACRRAGAVFLGKTATSELAILPFIHTELHPPARNPFDPGRYAGGSSGGSAAAVAAGMLPMAPGSDGAGSIRIPASFCGLVGVKPGRGVLVNPYRRFDRAGISVQGPLARDVRDAALLFDALAGRIAAQPVAGSFRAACERPPASLRVGLWRRSALAATDAEVDAVVMDAAARLDALGHRIEEGPDLPGEIDEFLPLMARTVASVPLPGFLADKLQPTTVWLRRRGRQVTAAGAAAAREQLQRRILAWASRFDVWLTPTVAQLPPEVGAFDGLSGEATFRRAAQLGAFTAPFNASGQPALSLPAGRSQAGLPIGVQLVGQRGGDANLISLAAQLEQAW